MNNRFVIRKAQHFIDCINSWWTNSNKKQCIYLNILIKLQGHIQAPSKKYSQATLQMTYSTEKKHLNTIIEIISNPQKPQISIYVHKSKITICIVTQELPPKSRPLFTVSTILSRYRENTKTQQLWNNLEDNPI